MKVAIVGGTGYGAVELMRFINNHPYATLELVIAHSQTGKKVSDVYPHMQDVWEIQMDELNVGELQKNVDLVFFATPPGVSKEIAPSLMDQGVTCIDLSGDFRLERPDVYETWYETTAADPSYLRKATYGLSEIYKEEIQNASYIANPGCYPTASLLGILPLIQQKWVDPATIIIDAKSGVSGAGRSTSLMTHFAEMNDNLKAYKLGKHKHIPEIEQILQKESGQLLNVTFSTHLIPMTRGIMATIYSDLTVQKSTEDIINMYEAFYEHAPFVRIRANGNYPATKEVYGSNYCDIGILSDERTRKVTVISVIDNLVKGAAGQAIQNMNLLNNWDEKTGLDVLPVYP
ncbi:N-acetyl-gamma-glutamyl-phosphate reductase [Radiobacillus deserti]|uniref:N-acetyl-gamma-glutamyl-phosphate reductase n=1 Tax=Radiobacillus deserti TaxID=2594883 RepID=A0A516KKB2_9BACI|nr:N-acetyl-gamma-glutamyl-phosphate reductase [Radiobacillus deserti]QDP41817.1 N-acetyl-gamma-glutamyl-phosphate reductase [Radiobacillus deserti]